MSENATPPGEESSPLVITRAMSLRATAGSFVGAVVEWYDFLLYSVLAALVFNHQFFPSDNPTAATLASFATIAIGFLFRPLGAIFFGHYGDRIGPKRVLVWTIITMGLATASIGVLPNFQTIGVWAPILLCLARVVQGFAVGGEWGGAALMAVSQAPKGRKAFYSSGVQMGYGVGLILANGFVLLLTVSVGRQAVQEWAWRLPFALSLLLTAVGLWVRAGVADIKPVDTAPEELKEAKMTKPPLLEALTRHPLAFLQIIGIRMAEMFSMYVVTTFALSYTTQNLHWDSTLFLNVALWVGAISLVTIPFFAYLSDRFGRKKVYLTGAAVGIVFAFPFFMAMGANNRVLTFILALVLVNICHDMAVSVQQPLITELFGAEYQYSGAGFGYQVAAVIDGGFTPFIAAAIVAAMGGTWVGVAIYLLVGCVISFLVVAFLRPKVHDTGAAKPEDLVVTGEAARTVREDR